MKNDKLRLVPFRKKKDISPYIIPVLELMNETYEDVYGFLLIKKKYRGLGIDVMIDISIFETAQKRGYLVMDSHLEIESSYKVRVEMEKTGGSIYKRYMIYSKTLTR